MRFVTGGDYRMKDCLLLSMRQAEKFGYRLDVYDFGGLTFGTPYKVHHWDKHGNKIDGPIYEKDRFLTKDQDGLTTGSGACPTKQDFIYDHWKKCHEMLVYLDADAIIADRLDEANGDFDVGVTMKKPDEMSIPEVYRPFREFCHAGVVFVNKTRAAEVFLQRWIAARDVAYTYSDQHALDVVLRSEVRDLGYDLRGKTVKSLGGIKIHFFPREQYNHLISRNQFHKAKIIHIAGDLAMKRRVHNPSFLESLRKCES